MGRFSNSVSWTPSQNDPLESTSFSDAAAGHSFFLPLHYTPTYQYPLVVWLHNNGFNENQIDDVMPYISTRNYIGVGIRATKAADAVGHRFDWHQGKSAIGAAHDSIVEAVDEAAERFSIHPERVVLAGYRAGGTMALRVALRQPNRFAAAVSLGGRMPHGAIRNINQLRQRRLPMLWQWGVANPDYTSENLKSDCQLVMNIGSQVEVRQYPVDDEMNTAVLKDIDEFVMRRIVNESSAVDSDRWSSCPTAYSAN